jgi:hypothetical protein
MNIHTAIMNRVQVEEFFLAGTVYTRDWNHRQRQHGDYGGEP